LSDFIAIDRLKYAQLDQAGRFAGGVRAEALIAWKVQMQSLGALAHISYKVRIYVGM